MSSEQRCGYVAIIGRPNVGKSTLLNCLISAKISITARKPQTTRHNIMGIYTQDNVQIVFVDTPGLHRGQKAALNRYMNRSALHALADVDVVLFVVEGLIWREEDAWVLEKLRNIQKPVILVINKVDTIEQRDALLPQIEKLSRHFSFSEIVPVSASKKVNTNELLQVISQHLPQGAHLFGADQLTDRSERFLAAELVREKLTRLLGQELPYALATETEAFKRDEKILRISVIIYVERDNQKGIVIGKGGALLKKVGQTARVDMEKLFDSKVFLELRVKVKPEWSKDEEVLRNLGYR